MPWTVQEPPSPPVGEDWAKDEIEACVAAANSVLEDGGTEGEAIQACIAAAGRSAKSQDPDEASGMVAESLVAPSNEPIKALGDGRVGAYGLRWGSPDERDLQREYFAQDTDLGPHGGDGMAATVHHRIPLGDEPEAKALAKRILARPVKATKDAIGIFVEHVLDMADEYEAAIYRLTEKGKLRWSSGTASHMADTEPDGKIKLWHIIEWAYTPQAAEPRLPQIMPLKALMGLDYPQEPMPESPGASLGAEGQGGQGRGPGGHFHKSTDASKGENTMGDRQDEGQGSEFATLSPEQIDEIAAKLAPQIGAVISPQVAEQILAGMAQPEGKGKAQPKGKGMLRLRDSQGSESLGDFLISIVDGDHERLKSVYGSEIVETIRTKARGKDLTGASGQAGAYLVPPQFLPELLSIEPFEAVVRPRAHVQPMASDTIQIPRLNVAAQPSAGSTYHFGGVLAYWTEAGAETTETEPGFKQMKLEAHKLGGHTQVGEELYDDEGIGLSALLNRLFGGAILWVEDYTFLRGTGAGQPLGVLTSDAKLTQARATANKFDLADAANMMGQFMPGSFGRGVWVMNITVLPELVQLDDGGSNVVWIPNAREGLPMTLFGMPVMFTDKTPALGTEGDVMLCDFGYYVIGDRQRLAIAASEHFAFTSGLITIRFTHRIDGQPWLEGPIYVDDTNQISPFVVLTDAS